MLEILNKAGELSHKLEKEIHVQSLQATNVVRRLAKRETDLAKEQNKTCQLEKEVSDLHCTVTELRRMKKNKTEQLRYNIVKRTETEKKLDIQNVELKQKLKRAGEGK